MKNIFKLFSLIILVATAGFLLAGCETDNEPPSQPPSNTDQTPGTGSLSGTYKSPSTSVIEILTFSGSNFTLAMDGVEAARGDFTVSGNTATFTFTWVSDVFKQYAGFNVGETTTGTISGNNLIFGNETWTKQSDGGSNTPKTITITGITGETGDVQIEVVPIPVAVPEDITKEGRGTGTITGDSVTVDLYFRLSDGGAGSTRYTTSGQHFISINFLADNFTTWYVYTEGKSLAELGINNFQDLMAKHRSYNIVNAVTSIPFNQFIDAKSVAPPGGGD